MKTKQRLIAAIKIWVIIYPSITLFLYLFNEALSSLPLYMRTFVLTLTLVPWIVFVGMPFLEWILRIVSGNNEQKNA